MIYISNNSDSKLRDHLRLAVIGDGALRGAGAGIGLSSGR